MGKIHKQLLSSLQLYSVVHKYSKPPNADRLTELLHWHNQQCFYHAAIIKDHITSQMSLYYHVK